MRFKSFFQGISCDKTVKFWCKILSHLVALHLGYCFVWYFDLSSCLTGSPSAALLDKLGLKNFTVDELACKLKEIKMMRAVHILEPLGSLIDYKV